MESVVRCLAVRQPWAWALVAGAKDIENRSWGTDYRGPVVILASSTKSDLNAIMRACKTPLPSMRFDHSALVGIVDVLDVSPLSEELESNPWAWGTQCWRVGNARRFRAPIPAKGKLNLFTLPPDLAERARVAIAGAEVVQLDEGAKAWVAGITSLDTEQSRNQALMNSYIELGDAKNALRLAEMGVAKWGTAENYFDRAAARRAAGNLLGALEDANRGLAMDPGNAGGYAVRSNVYLTLSEVDRVKAAEIDPQYATELEQLQAEGEGDE